MNSFPPTLPVRSASEQFAPYAEKLQTIFAAMDLAYTEVAEAYGFLCTGCEDNCCRTRFYHHTYLEWFYLHHGWEELESGQRAALRSRAEEVYRSIDAGGPGRETSKGMCPLNVEGLCGLYEYRPMICRLHGIPHTLQRPDGRKMDGPGCDAFQRQCGLRGAAVLERTPHYSALAALEQQFRRALGLTDRLKLTVTDMIVQFNCSILTT